MSQVAFSPSGRVGVKQLEPGAAKLLSFQVGALMRVNDVHIARGFGKYDRRVIIELYDEFTEKGDASTALTIEMPEKLSPAFAERPQVEELAQQILNLQP